MYNTRKMKRAERELRSLRHRANPHPLNRKLEKRRSRLSREYRRLRALESRPARTKTETKKPDQ
jgi:hypothetical protein